MIIQCKCTHCGTEYFFKLTDKIALQCEKCGGSLEVILREKEKEIEYVQIPVTPIPCYGEGTWTAPDYYYNSTEFTSGGYTVCCSTETSSGHYYGLDGAATVII